MCMSKVATNRYTLLSRLCLHLLQKQSPLEYMHECHNRAWYLRVYSHVLESLNGEEFWQEIEETPILPPTFKVAPGRPKKKRNMSSDVVQTRENVPTRLKRAGTSLKCTWCKEWRHNTRTCNQKVLLSNL